MDTEIQELNFIFVGTMKSGATSLGHRPHGHRSICIPKEEVHFFNNEENFSKGLDWYTDVLTDGIDDNSLIVGDVIPAESRRGYK